MNTNKIKLAITACIFIVIAILGETIYRPWIRQTGMFDFYIANNLKWLLLPSLVFFVITPFKKKPIKIRETLSGLFTGSVIYILLDNFNCFNYKAIIAALAGCGITFVTYKLLEKIK